MLFIFINKYINNLFKLLNFVLVICLYFLLPCSMATQMNQLAILGIPREFLGALPAQCPPANCACRAFVHSKTGFRPLFHQLPAQLFGLQFRQFCVNFLPFPSAKPIGKMTRQKILDERRRAKGARQILEHFVRVHIILEK